MEEENKVMNMGGCLPPTIDLRDFKHKAFFGVGELPTVNFRVVQSPRILDQGTTDFCVAFATTSCSEDQERVPLAPEYIAKKIIDPYGYGAEIRAGLEAHRNYGCVEESESSVHVSTDSRAEILSPKNWTLAQDELAKKHKKLSYFRIDNALPSKFDSIRMTLWQHKDDPDPKPAVTGAVWYSEWTYAIGGIVPKTYSNKYSGHCFKIIGQEYIAGEPYLVIQNSGGKDYGNQGLWFFPKSVVDKEFYPTYMEVDATEEEIKKVQLTLIGKLKELIQLYVILIARKAMGWWRGKVVDK